MKQEIYLRKVAFLFSMCLFILIIFVPSQVNAVEKTEVTYLDGDTVKTHECLNVQENMSTGWYAVTGEGVAYNNAIVITGDVNLILGDNTKSITHNGVYITEGSKLTIWAQSKDDRTAGQLTAEPDESGPGIGGVEDTRGGSLVVNGGVIHAIGAKYGAGIGGGRTSDMESVTINDGYVFAHGNGGGAGIGGGQHGDLKGTVRINGGYVEAIGSEQYAANIICGAGIGGGYAANAKEGTVIITGGTVVAEGHRWAAGIGGGMEIETFFTGGEGADVKIYGGVVYASSGLCAIGHGGTDDGFDHTDEYMGNLTIADDMMVSAGNDNIEDVEAFTFGERVDACNYRRFARIEPCDHSDYTYIDITDKTHTRVCKYCTSKREPIEEHTVDSAGQCSLCGYDYGKLITKIRFRTLKSSIAEGETLQLDLTIIPSDAANQTVTWTSADESVLKVNETGQVTGIKEGKARVTAKATDLSGVSVSRVITVKHIHDNACVLAEDPSCTKNGNIEYWKCTKCGKCFSDQAGTIEIPLETTVIEALGHEWGEWYTAEDGSQSHTCSICEVTESIPAGHNHSITKVDGQESGCTTSGWEAYYQCSECGMMFEDESGTVQTNESKIKIPATGHTSGEAKKDKETPATCISVGGYNLTTRCKDCGAVLSVEHVVTDIDHNAHDWDEWAAIEGGEGLEEHVCLNDTSHMEIKISNAKVVLSASAFTYNGKVLKPSVRTIGNRSMKSGTDYTVSDVSSKNVGTYTVTIIGKGSYTGVAKATYRINPKGTSIKKPKKAKKAIRVKWKKQSAKMATSRITGYQILLATDSQFTKNKKTVNVKGYKKTSKKVKKLKGKTKYYVKVRTYKTIGGTTYYSGWSKVKTVKTR